MADRPNPYAAPHVTSLLGKRVRAVVRGSGAGLLVDEQGFRQTVTSRTVVVGTVVGWEHYDGVTYVDIGGHGRVPRTDIRRAHWWHRA